MMEYFAAWCVDIAVDVALNISLPGSAPEKGSGKMKYFILAAATAISLSGSAIANASSPEPKGYEAGVKIGASGSRTAVEIAMGPTSAAHLPGGTGMQPASPPANCALPPDQCPKRHKRTKRRHGQPSHHQP